MATSEEEEEGVSLALLWRSTRLAQAMLRVLLQSSSCSAIAHGRGSEEIVHRLVPETQPLPRCSSPLGHKSVALNLARCR